MEKALETNCDFAKLNMKLYLIGKYLYVILTHSCLNTLSQKGFGDRADLHCSFSSSIKENKI